MTSGSTHSSKPTSAVSLTGQRPRFAEIGIVFLLALLMYGATAGRDVLWGDPAKLSRFVHDQALSFGQESHIGHVLWSSLFTVLPVESFAWRMHLSSAITMALALAIGYWTLAALGVGRRAAVLGIAAVAVAHTVWLNASIHESYSLVLLVLACAARLMVARQVVLAGLVIGLGVLAHPLCLFSAPPLAFLLLTGPRRWKGVLLFGAAVAVAWLGPVFGAAFIRASQAGEGVDWFALVQEKQHYARLDYPLKNAPLLAGYWVYNFASPALLLMLVGLRRMDKRRRFAAAIMIGIHYGFALFWMPQRSYLIVVPVYAFMAYMVARGAEHFIQRRTSMFAPLLASIVLLPVAAYVISPPVVRALNVLPPINYLPFRDAANYFLRSSKFDEDSARSLLTALDGQLPQGSVLVGDWTVLSVIRYAQRVEGWRRDVHIHEDLALSNRAGLDAVRVTEHLQKGERVFLLDYSSAPPPALLIEAGTLKSRDKKTGLQEVIRRQPDAESPNTGQQ